MSGKPSRARKAKAASKAKVDPITISVIRGILETTQREMTLSLEKTARSSVFNLAHDYSTALFNDVPEMILQGQDIPTVKVCLRAKSGTRLQIQATRLPLVVQYFRVPFPDEC